MKQPFLRAVLFAMLARHRTDTDRRPARKPHLLLKVPFDVCLLSLGYFQKRNGELYDKRHLANTGMQIEPHS